MKKVKLQAPYDEGANPTTDKISSEEKVFSIVELLEKILRYLTPIEQLKCRQVNSLWRAEAGILLEKASDFDLVCRKFEDDFRVKEFPFKANFNMRVNFLNRLQTATRFRSTKDIQTFLEYMGDFNGNPFPSRTVIFCVGSFLKVEQVSLAELVLRFGDEIQNCFAAFDDEITLETDHARDFIAKLFLLKNLKFLSLSRAHWHINMNTNWNLPRMENLKQVQIYGIGAGGILQWFSHLGSLKQIEILHLHGTRSPHIDNKLDPDSLPNLMKLVVTNGSYSFRDDLFGGKLEELSVSQDGISLRLTYLLTPLTHADKAHWNTLRRISIRTDQYVPQVQVYSNKNGSNGGENFVDCAKVQYPNLKEVGISHRLLEEFPWLLKLFAAKFPKWEKIHLYNNTNNTYRELDEAENKRCLRRFDSFEDICADLWKLLPDSVTTIIAEWEWAEKKTTRPQSD